MGMATDLDLEDLETDPEIPDWSVKWELNS